MQLDETNLDLLCGVGSAYNRSHTLTPCILFLGGLHNVNLTLHPIFSIAHTKPKTHHDVHIMKEPIVPWLCGLSYLTFTSLLVALYPYMKPFITKYYGYMSLLFSSIPKKLLIELKLT